MKLADEYCAVGVAEQDGAHSCVVIRFNYTTIRLPEQQARKLADDILRNANYLWPIEGKNA